MNNNVFEKEDKITDHCNNDIHKYKFKLMKLKEQNKLLQEKYNNLVKINHQLQQECDRDFLTELLNRRGLMKKIKSLQENFKMNNEKFTIIFLDIDKFRVFNNNYGHSCGDFILIRTAKTIKKIVNKYGYVARWGGEEFIIILFNSNAKQGQAIAEKIRKEIANKVYNYQNLDLSITITLGISVFDENIDISEYIKRADSSMYLGKSNGGNCVVLDNDIL